VIINILGPLIKPLTKLCKGSQLITTKADCQLIFFVPVKNRFVALFGIKYRLVALPSHVLFSLGAPTGVLIYVIYIVRKVFSNPFH